LGGSDQFVFETDLDALTNQVHIGDFTAGQDHIVLASSVFTALGANHTLSDTSFLTIGSRAIDSDDHVIYDPSNGNIYFDPDAAGAGAAIVFATVTPSTHLTASDFFVA
jgi:Ca2+-binding RTX toxin-like protein